MTPKERMIVFCAMPGEKQVKYKDELLDALEDFLETATYGELGILNHDKSFPFEYSGMVMFAETYVLMSKYSAKILGRPE